MKLRIKPLYAQGRRLTERELDAAPSVNGEVTIDQMTEHETRKVFRRAACIAIGGFNSLLPDLIEPKVVAISKLGMGIEEYEKVQTEAGVMYFRQAWWCREVEASSR
jgi:hypothetical protein